MFRDSQAGSAETAEGQVWIGVLGPLEVVRDGATIRLGSGRQRSVLAVLVASLGRVVSTDRLIDDVWGAESGSERHGALWVHVSNLRKAIEPDPSSPRILQTRSPGYVLDASAVTVDVGQFEQLVAEGRSLLATDPSAASLVLGEALGLWRGNAYEAFFYDDWAQAEIARLSEMRLETVEMRIEADLRRGMATELVAELEGLVRANPTREGLTASLMVALYRAGRQAEALGAYSALKGRLGTELGIEPSVRLRRLQERMVLGDPELLEMEHQATSGPSVRGYELREELGRNASTVSHRAFQPSLGREVVVKVYGADVADDPEFIRRFESDSRSIHRVEHPHIVPLYDFWREPGAAYVVTRYVEGGSLAQRLAHGELDRAIAATVADQIGAALIALHRAGVVLGGLTPDQVLIDTDGNAYLVDVDRGAGVTVGAGSSTADDVRGYVSVVLQALVGRAGDLSDLLVGSDPTVAELLRSDVEDDVAAARSALLETLDTEPAAVVVDENPYKALRSFEPTDARDFFGRERFVDRLVSRLSRAGTQGRFVVVVGPSGSGKSSVVKAGLLPALSAGAAPGSEAWFTASMTPGTHPFEELESALLSVAVDPPPSLLEMIGSEAGIAGTVEAILPDESTLVLVIDQFEELFTQSDASESERFIGAVATAVNRERSRLRVVVTLRADFYDRPLRHLEMSELFRIGTEVLTPMSATELQRAILGPAERVGAVCEPALVSEMVAAVADRPAALPLLQYALTELFDRRDGHRLTLDAYEAIGGVSGALVDRAEAIYRDLPASARWAAREVFLRLVSLGDGAGDTRRRALVSEIQSLGGRGAETSAVIDTFSRHRLLSLDRDPSTRTPTVEIAHESLLETWERLAGWIDEARSDIRAARRLADAAADWAARGRPDDDALVGSRLARYDGWLESPPVAITDVERDLLSSSWRVEHARRTEIEAATEREALLQRRSRSLLLLAIITLVVGGLGVFAFQQRGDAEALAGLLSRTDTARRIALAATTELGNDVELGANLAVAAARATADDGVVVPEAMDALHRSVRALRLQYPVGDVVVGVRPGIGGVFSIPPTELVRLVSEGRSSPLTEEQCEAFAVDPCDAWRPDDGLEVQGGEEIYLGPGDDRPLAGTVVRIVTNFASEDELAARRSDFASFTAETGIFVDLSFPQFGAIGFDVIRDPGAADISFLPQPGFMPEAVAAGVLDLTRFLDRGAMVDSFGEHLVSLASVDADGKWPSESGSVYGLWSGLDLKSILWYRPDLIEPPPSTWDDLIDVSASIASDHLAGNGPAPFCFALDGIADPGGWPATDVVEAMVLKSQGPEVYDAWVEGSISFSDPEIVGAVEAFADFVHTDGHLALDPDRSINPSWMDAAIGANLDDPSCVMFSLPGFTEVVFETMGVQNVQPAPFPSFDDRFADAVVGGGSMAVGLADRPEVRALLRFMSTPEYGAGSAANDFARIPAHRDFPTESIASPLTRQMAEAVHNALDAGTFRFDASDLMPSDVSRAFWGAMRQLFAQGPGDVPQILGNVDVVRSR